MKVRVRIDDRTYVVDIEDPQAEPVIAIVDGHRYELWPEEAPALREPDTTSEMAPPFTTEREVRAPLPGVVVSVSVQPGASVTVGQELCVLEAMKMRNPICAGRAGVIASVHVTPGKHVQHRETIMEFAE
jgi:glutaconyl-CoA/methylmalonyl-CoA decarboxylase subunit gamma